jgi:hypothetical protein
LVGVAVCVDVPVCVGVAVGVLVGVGEGVVVMVVVAVGEDVGAKGLATILLSTGVWISVAFTAATLSTCWAPGVGATIVTWKVS